VKAFALEHPFLTTFAFCALVDAVQHVLVAAIR